MTPCRYHRRGRLSPPPHAGASPRTRCGDLDARWAGYETADCGLLARDELGHICPRRAGGPWPRSNTARIA
jgi:hypothetical protein